MPAPMVLSKIEGVDGEIRVGKTARAARLASWMVVPGEGEGRWAFAGRLQDQDAYLCTQGPDTVLLSVGQRTWRWTGVTLEIAGDSVRGTLQGPPEER